MKKTVLILALFLPLFGATRADAGATNQIWFLNLIYPSWTCDADVASACYANNWREYAFSYVYPALGVDSAAQGDKTYFILNEWSAVSGPGTLTWGDSPTLWMADNTYDGARGRSNLRYLGDLSPNVTGLHWGGYPLVKLGASDWVFLLESTPDDHRSTLYYRRGNPLNFDGPANDGFPGPPTWAFTSANTIWKESQVCDTRLGGMTYVPDPNGQAILYGFVTWNGRKMVGGNCQYAYNGLFMQVDPVVIDFVNRRFKINGTWYAFGSEFPIDVNSEQPDTSHTYTGSWDIAETPWGYYAFRSKGVSGQGSPSVTPVSCYDPNHWATNLNLDRTGEPDYLRSPLATLQYARVDPTSGTLLSGWTTVSSPWLPGKNRGGAQFAGIGSWSHGTYLYQSTNELTACWASPLVTWNLQSGSSYLVYDWTP